MKKVFHFFFFVFNILSFLLFFCFRVLTRGTCVAAVRSTIRLVIVIFLLIVPYRSQELQRTHHLLESVTHRGAGMAVYVVALARDAGVRHDGRVLFFLFPMLLQGSDCLQLGGKNPVGRHPSNDPVKPRVGEINYLKPVSVMDKLVVARSKALTQSFRAQLRVRSDFDVW